MKILAAFISLFAVSAGPLLAQEAGGFGAGVIIGNPTGITGKYWLSGSRAMDAGVGLGSDVSLYGDYLWHSFEALPQPSKGKLPAYVGVGLQLEEKSSGESGIRGVVGIAYWFQGKPLELFVEAVPLLRFSSGDSLSVGAGLGLRYYFTW